MSLDDTIQACWKHYEAVEKRLVAAMRVWLLSLMMYRKFNAAENLIDGALLPVPTSQADIPHDLPVICTSKVPTDSQSIRSYLDLLALTDDELLRWARYYKDDANYKGSYAEQFGIITTFIGIPSIPPDHRILQQRARWADCIHKAEQAVDNNQEVKVLRDGEHAVQTEAGNDPAEWTIKREHE